MNKMKPENSNWNAAVTAQLENLTDTTGQLRAELDAVSDALGELACEFEVERDKNKESSNEKIHQQ